MAREILDVKNRKEFREWLEKHHDLDKECWVILKRGRPQNDNVFYYIDAVEEALCFGWIDSTLGLINGIRAQRFSPRTKNSNWNQLNKERVKRLEKIGLMTDSGKSAYPDMTFEMDESILKDMKEAGVYDMFMTFPQLYQRIRSDVLSKAKIKDQKEYFKMFKNFVEKTKQGKMYGEWNDYGRLTE